MNRSLSFVSNGTKKTITIPGSLYSNGKLIFPPEDTELFPIPGQYPVLVILYTEDRLGGLYKCEVFATKYRDSYFLELVVLEDEILTRLVVDTQGTRKRIISKGPSWLENWLTSPLSDEEATNLLSLL